MKKGLSIAIALAMLVSCFTFVLPASAEVDSEGYTLIYDAADLLAIDDSAESLAGKYRLANNIDLKDSGYNVLKCIIQGTFTGTLDGAGYAIENMNYSSSDCGNWGKLALIEITKGATVINICVDRVATNVKIL